MTDYVPVDIDAMEHGLSISCRYVDVSEALALIAEVRHLRKVRDAADELAAADNDYNDSKEHADNRTFGKAVSRRIIAMDKYAEVRRG